MYHMQILDLISVVLALIFSYLIRFDFEIPGYYINQLLILIIPISLLKLCIFNLRRTYKIIWKYFSLSDLTSLIITITLQSVALILLTLFVFNFEGFSRSVYIIDWMLSVLLCVSTRYFIRIYSSNAFSFRINVHPGYIGKSKRILLVGSEDYCEKVIRSIKSDTSSNVDIIGIIGLDDKFKNKTIHKVPVLGALSIINDFIENNDIDELLVTEPGHNIDQMQLILKELNKVDIPFKVLPPTEDLIKGHITINSFREVDYLDLLGREPVLLDTPKITELIHGQNVLITGCGGSIGSELTKQVLKYGPKSLLLMDSCEYNLHTILQYVSSKFDNVNVVPLLGLIQDNSFLHYIFSNYKIDIVFHAAAYKHVPMLEINSWQAVLNNINGTKLMMDYSDEYNVNKFVLVSTDKAVRPTNIMGASKRITEKLMNLYIGSNTKFMAVRFGNVIGSSGSVLPLFIQQIRNGGPITVTHPEVNRYFMSISEAAQLILQAGAISAGNEIFVLKMGSSIKILDMAETLIKLSGKRPYKDIDIVFTGLRDGEKLYEELITDDENIAKTSHDKILILQPQTDFDCSIFKDKLATLNDCSTVYDKRKLVKLIAEIVPEFSSQ